MEYNKLKDIMQLTMCDLNNEQNKDGIGIINHPKYSCHSELYEKEIKQICILTNNFITNLQFEKDRLNNNFELFIPQNKMSELGKNMKTMHTIINQLKILINIENSRLSIRSHTVKDKHELDKLIHRINWMKNSIYLAIVRYNEIGKFLDLPTCDLFAEIKKQTEPFRLNYTSKKRTDEIEDKLKIKEKDLILVDLRTSIELLKSRIVDYGIYPIYRLLSKNTSGKKFAYSCSLFGLYVEGNGSSKYEAKENTAAKMLRTIIKRQKKLSLTSHIRAFNEKELKTLSPFIKFKTNYVNLLANSCVKNKFPPPIYTYLSYTKNDIQLKEYYSIQCNAMDLVAIGHCNNRTAAKQISAQNILVLWEENNSKNKPSEQL